MTTLFSFRMGYRHIRAKFGQVALSIVAIALGVALVVAVQLMNDAVLESFFDDIDTMAGRADLTVTAGDGAAFDESVADQIKRDVPAVEVAVPLVTASAFINDKSKELLTVHALNLADPRAVEVYQRGNARDIIADKFNFFIKTDSIILPRALANRRGLAVGDTIELVTPVGVKPFTIRGLLDPEGIARTLRGRLVIMDLYAAEAVFTEPGKINQIDLVVAKGLEEAAKKLVAAKLPPGLRVEEIDSHKAVIRDATKAFRALVTAFSFLAVLAGFLVCFSRLGAIFEARTWEAGLLRAVGLSRLTVFAELLKESLLLGIIGTIPGVPLGIVIAHVGLPQMAKTMALQFRAPIAGSDAALTVRALVIGAAVGVTAAVVAAVLPALRLARTQPVAALTMRGRDLVTERRPIAWRWRAGLFAAIAALLVLQSATHAPMIGNVTTLLVALAACAMAAPLLRIGSELLVHIWPPILGPAGKFTARHLHQQGRRASLLVATLGAGLGVVLMFGMLDWSFEHTLLTQLTARYRAELILTSRAASGGYLRAPLNDAIVRDVAAVPGVAEAGGWQRRSVTYQAGQERPATADTTIVIDAYDPAFFTAAKLSEWSLTAAYPDALRDVGAGKGVIVSSPFAHLFDARLGDVIRLMSPHGQQEFRVVAITDTEPFPSVIMSRQVYRRDWNDNMITWVFAAIDPAANRGDVEKEISNRFVDKYLLMIQSSAGLIRYFMDQVKQAFKPTYLMAAITFVLVLIGTGDTLAMGIIERTRELGVMRAIGLMRRHVFGLVMLEGFVIGLLGLILAAAGGMALGLFWAHVQIPALAGWTFALHVPYKFMLAAAGVALLLSLIGSLLPSIRAAYISVPAALRTE